MATITMEPAVIKTAMSKIGLDNRTDELLDILDEMELDRNLTISLEQADRKEGRSVDDVVNDLLGKIRNGN